MTILLNKIYAAFFMKYTMTYLNIILYTEPPSPEKLISVLKYQKNVF